jgi:autotransporter-associated beta strand protein
MPDSPPRGFSRPNPKKRPMKNLRHHLLALATLPLCSAGAADLYWDGGTANIATNGDGISTYTGGTWSTGISNWDVGSGVAHAAWDNGTLNSAIFGGTYATGARNVTLGSSITVNQIQINTGSTGGNRYDILPDAGGLYAITFGGTYSDVFPAITGPGGSNGFLNNNFSAKITGTISGGLIVKHGSNITTPGSSGRFAFGNVNNDFIGDVVMVGGNLGANSAVLGNPANKLVLKGGALFVSGGAGTSTFTRNIDVGAPSGISTNSVGVGQILDLTGTITGSGNLTRYASNGGSNTSEVRLSGDLSGYSGTIEATGTANSLMTIQSTATSGGAWKLSGSGTLKLNTTDNTHIADGAGKSDLLMNGGTLDMNGKSETINGLNGATGTVQNQLAATSATLTLGAGDATATFGGTVRDNSGTGGTLALTKLGSGTQTIGGNCNITGNTTVEAGGLIVGGNIATSAITVKSGAKFGVTGVGKDLTALTLESGTTLSAPLDVSTNYLGVDNALTFSGGTVTVVPTFTDAPAIGTYDYIVATGGITGTATLATDFSTAGSSRVNGSAQIVGNAVKVTISSLGAALTWNNHAGTGIWDLNTSANFLNGAANDVFKQYDAITFGPTSPAGTVTLTGALRPTSVTVNSSSDFTFTGSGSIIGGATLTKDGSGTLTVANANTFTGATAVNSGKLAVTGSLTGSNVTVASGATLTGTGTVSGSVTVEGAVSPGASVGTLALATGPVSLSGTYLCDIDGATCDKLAVTGDLDLTDATLTLNTVSAPTAPYYVIATYTGSVTGNFASVPAGYIVDTTEAGKVTLRTPSVAPPAGTITFETDQSYPAATTELAGVNADANGAAFSGTQGWSLSTSSVGASVQATASSGEYVHSQAIGTSGSGTYVGGIKNVIQYTGSNTITFDAPYYTGTSIGFMKDLDNDGLFDGNESGMAFGIGGSPAKFQYRDAAFGPENFGATFTGTAGHWYHFSITIGDSVGGSRSITMAVRNLTTGVDFDFDAGTAGIQPWTFSVTDAQFGAAPEVSDGLFTRMTTPARIDNLRVTSVNPPVATAYDTWMNGFPSLAGANKLPDADPDHDGVKNLLEFVLNGNPTTSDAAILPTSSVAGGNMIITFQRRDDSEGLVNQTVQHGINLATWSNVVIGAADGSSGGATYTVTENGSSPDLITVTIPTAGDAKKFARLLVEQAP